MKRKKACFIGNPNVGKSTIFNILTNKTQHTGNWTGKTVENEVGEFTYKNILWEVIDLPGTYSLIGESKEEKIASQYIQEEDYDIAVVVLDATNLERSIEILLEVLDIKTNVIACLNLFDEAQKRNITIDVSKLKNKLNLPIITTNAKEKKGIEELCETMNKFIEHTHYPIIPKHTPKIENYLQWAIEYIEKPLTYLTNNKTLKEKEKNAKLNFYRKSLTRIDLLESYHEFGTQLLSDVIDRTQEKEKKEDHFWNTLLTNPISGFVTMLLMLFIILWLTIYLSNIPSSWLFNFFEHLELLLFNALSFLPDSILNPLLLGGYRTLYWVVSVMLPPMLIFFPLFALLEDYGLFPRIAFNLDKPFAKCGSCGKQSLTMCMGLGCNAVGVTSTRIMESKKMRILSILTNVFMPCNGRFPAMICVINMFFVTDHSFLGSMTSSLILLAIILLGIFLTWIVTKILNHFLLKEEKSMFILELPSFRKPKIIGTILHSWKERAIPVLKRAMLVSFPAGILIYFVANINIGEITILERLYNLLNPFGLLIGVDGIILLSFLLGIPANEIVIPILLLCYTNSGSLIEYESIESLRQILIVNGWTTLTAINFLLLCLCHFPCATTLLTIKKETQSTFYAILAFLIPTLIGIGLCFLATLIF